MQCDGDLLIGHDGLDRILITLSRKNDVRESPFSTTKQERVQEKQKQTM